MTFEDIEYVTYGENDEWFRCPKCGSEEISGHSFEADGMSVWQEVECASCGATWLEVYAPAHREIPKET